MWLLAITLCPCGHCYHAGPLQTQPRAPSFRFYHSDCLIDLAFKFLRHKTPTTRKVQLTLKTINYHLTLKTINYHLFVWLLVTIHGSRGAIEVKGQLKSVLMRNPPVY